MLLKSNLLVAKVKTLEQRLEEMKQQCLESENQQRDNDQVNLSKEQVQTINHNSYVSLN